MKERIYIKRFNQGYSLMKFHPDLAEKLKQGLNEKENLSGQDKALMDGMSEHRKEKIRENMTERSNDRQHQGKGQKR